MDPVRRRLIPLAAAFAATAGGPARAEPSRAARSTGGPAMPGLALGVGSLHGFAHLGVIKAFEARGVRPAVIAGASAGAIAGALWASGMDWKSIRDAASDLGWWSWRMPSLNGGLLRNDVLGRMIDERTRGRPIESWSTRFGAVATDFATGERVLLRAGRAGAAVQASSSLPVLYEPVQIDGRMLVDGALSEPIPIRAARELGATTVIAIDVAYRPREETAKGTLTAPFQMTHILVDRLIGEQVREADLALRLDLHRYAMMDDPKARLIEAGEQAIAQHWPAIEALMGR